MNKLLQELTPVKQGFLSEWVILLVFMFYPPDNIESKVYSRKWFVNK
jgi:hypothetical protein